MRSLTLMLSLLALVAGAGAAMAQSTDATMRLVTLTRQAAWAMFWFGSSQQACIRGWAGR